MELEDRITFVEAKRKVKEEKSGEGLKQYLKDLYSYSTNPGYQYFVRCIVGDDYNTDDLWLLGGVQFFSGYNINLAQIDVKGMHHVNPFFVGNDNKSDMSSSFFWTHDSQKYCPQLLEGSSELENYDIVLAKIDVDDRFWKGGKANDNSSNKPIMDGLVYVSDYRKIARQYHKPDIGQKLDESIIELLYDSKKELNFFNLLVSGSPGAGKSHFVNDVFLNRIIDKKNEEREKYYERFIVSDSVTYDDLIGSYRPVDEDGRIVYSFVPGPFARILGMAFKRKKIEYLQFGEALKYILTDEFLESIENNVYVLVLEELSRGDAYNILGDLYLLLERDEYGESKYSVSIDYHFSEYLARGLCVDEPIQSIKLPSNFYVIATMNNADTGVSYLDASIRRRFTPIFIDHEGNRFGDKYTHIIKSEEMQISTNELLSIKKIEKDDAKELIEKINAKLEPDKRIASAVLNNPIYQEGINIIDLFNLTVGYLTQYVYRNDGDHQSFTWYLEKGDDKIKSLMAYLKGKTNVPKEGLFKLFESWEFI